MEMTTSSTEYILGIIDDLHRYKEMFGGCKKIAKNGDLRKEYFVTLQIVDHIEWWGLGRSNLMRV